MNPTPDAEVGKTVIVRVTVQGYLAKCPGVKKIKEKQEVQTK